MPPRRAVAPPSAAQRTLRPKLGSGLVGETAGLGVVDGVEVAIVVDNFVDVLMAGGEGVSF